MVKIGLAIDFEKHKTDLEKSIERTERTKHAILSLYHTTIVGIILAAFIASMEGASIPIILGIVIGIPLLMTIPVELSCYLLTKTTTDKEQRLYQLNQWIHEIERNQ